MLRALCTTFGHYDTQTNVVLPFLLLHFSHGFGLDFVFGPPGCCPAAGPAGYICSTVICLFLHHSFRTIYVNVYLIDFRQICRVDETVAVDNQSEIRSRNTHIVTLTSEPVKSQ